MSALLLDLYCFVVGVLLFVVVSVLCLYLFVLYLVFHVCRPCCFIALVLLRLSCCLYLFVRCFRNSCTCTLCLMCRCFVVLLHVWCC